MSEQQKKAMIKIGALWKSEKGDNLTGQMGDARLVVIPNQYKKEPKHPDFVVFIAEPNERKPRTAESKWSGATAGGQQQSAEPPPSESIDDIPF